MSIGHKDSIQNCTNRCPAKYKQVKILKTALQRNIKFDKSVLKASHSWRRNNIIGKQIPHISNTITKNDRLFFEIMWHLHYFKLLPLVLHTVERLKKYVRTNANQTIEHSVANCQITPNSLTV